MTKRSKVILAIIIAIAGILFWSISASAQYTEEYEGKEGMSRLDSLRKAGWLMAKPTTELYIKFDREDETILLNVEAGVIDHGDTVFLGYKDYDYELHWTMDKGDSIDTGLDLLDLPVSMEYMQNIAKYGIEYIDFKVDNNYFTIYIGKADNKEIKKMAKDYVEGR